MQGGGHDVEGVARREHRRRRQRRKFGRRGVEHVQAGGGTLVVCRVRRVRGNLLGDVIGVVGTTRMRGVDGDGDGDGNGDRDGDGSWGEEEKVELM